MKTIVESRKECNTSVTLGKYKFDMPIYPSNMASVVDEETCKYFAQHNWFYTMHRFGIHDPIGFTNRMHNAGLYSSISVGIDKEVTKRFKIVKEYNAIPDFITIDVANSWCNRMEYVIKFFRDTFPESFLIVGNIATPEAVEELQEWGAQSLKCGISNGKVCITRNKTGFTRPMASTILDCSEVAKVPIIADGGILDHGDIAKALSCGAHMVMAGNLFSGFDQSAGSVIEIEGRKYKEYFGSASEFNKNSKHNVEGKKILVDYKGNMDDLLVELKEDLQSSISYAGGTDLSAFNPNLLFQVR
jgi:GMP reductase